MRVLQAEQRPRSQSQLASGMFSYQAMTWPQDGQRERGVESVRGALSGSRDAEQLGAFLAPTALQHQREAVDDDVQEAADAQAENGQDPGGIEDLVRRHLSGPTETVRPPGPA